MTGTEQSATQQHVRHCVRHSPNDTVCSCASTADEPCPCTSCLNQVDAKLNGADVELSINDMDLVPETDDAPAFVDEVIAKRTSDGGLGQADKMPAAGAAAYAEEVVLADRAEQGLMNRGDRRSASPDSV